MHTRLLGPNTSTFREGTSRRLVHNIRPSDQNQVEIEAHGSEECEAYDNC